MMDVFTASTDLSWAAPSPTTTPAAAAAPSTPAAPAAYFNQETLPQRLQILIEGARESSTYAIFWQSSVDDAIGSSLLDWGDGYYKGCEEDKRKSRSSAADQEHRKKALRKLNSPISGGAGGGGDEAGEQEVEVTDTEWFFLSSMTKFFVNGDGLPGQALFSSRQPPRGRSL